MIARQPARTEEERQRRQAEAVAPLRRAYRELPPIDETFEALLAKLDRKMRREPDPGDA